jgi:hypothetical protein
MTEKIETYFALNNINDKVDLKIKEICPGRVRIELKTSELLNEKDLICVNKIVELSMPIGIMWDFENTCDANRLLKEKE